MSWEEFSFDIISSLGHIVWQFDLEFLIFATAINCNSQFWILLLSTLEIDTKKVGMGEARTKIRKSSFGFYYIKIYEVGP